MTSLHELQAEFAGALGVAGSSRVDSLLVSGGIPAAERVSIYRNNVRATFRAVLALGFPAVARLVGADYFRQLAGCYRQWHPSRSGNLQHVGGEFPEFLRTWFANSTFEYLADVAAVEWAYQEVLAAAEHAPLDLDILRAVPPDCYERLRMHLHPAARLVESRYPLVRIWRANCSDSIESEQIDLRAGGEQILLLRRGPEVEIHALKSPDFAFLSALAHGEPLTAALAAAVRADPAADSAALLRRYVELSVIVAVACDRNSASEAVEPIGRRATPDFINQRLTSMNAVPSAV